MIVTRKAITPHTEYKRFPSMRHGIVAGSINRAPRSPLTGEREFGMRIFVPFGLGETRMTVPHSEEKQR